VGKELYDPGKANRYTARDGTVFFVNANKGQIQTEDGGVALKFQSHGSMGRYTTVYLLFDEKRIKVSGPDDDNVVVSAEFIEGAVPPVFISRLINGLYSDGDKFENFEQQECMINLLVDMLSKFTIDWVGAAHGEEQNAGISLSETFLRKLKTGEYVEG